MRRYHTVRPYPDEELGSIVTRACRQVGLSQWSIAQHYFGAPRGTPLGSYGNLLLPVSTLTGMSPRELLWSHTLVPYGVAALPPALSRRVLNALTRGRELNESPVLGRIGRHWCEVCLRHDLAAYGEPYWHRSHLLPGVTTCHLHGTALLHVVPGRLVRAPIHRAVSYWIRGELPDELTGQPLRMPISWRLEHQLARWSASALKGRRGLPTAILPADELHRVFGPVLLRHAGCTSDLTSTWPRTTLRILSVVAARHLAKAGGGTQLEIFF